MGEWLPREEKAEGMGLLGMMVLLGPAMGPALGGWLTDNFTWPWIFFVNVPVGVVALFMGSQFLVDPPYMRGGERHIDGMGLGLLADGHEALQVLIEEGTKTARFTGSSIVILTAVCGATLYTVVLSSHV